MKKNFLRSKFRYPAQMSSRVSVYNEEEMDVDWKEVLVNRFQQISIKIKTIQNEDLHFFKIEKMLLYLNIYTTIEFQLLSLTNLMIFSNKKSKKFSK